MTSDCLKVRVEKMKRLEGAGKIMAFCDIAFGDLFLVRGFRIVDGKNGLFLGMPQKQNKEGQWFPLFTPATKEISEYLKEMAVEAYSNNEKKEAS